MCRPASVPADHGSVGHTAPDFTAQEHGRVAAWQDSVRDRGLCLETRPDICDIPGEFLLVAPCPGGKPAWLAHKTEAGAVAVKTWQGLADIVATVPEPLAIITTATHQGTA